MKYVDEIEVRGKRVLLRADLNVPLSDDGTIADDIRIRATVPTIELLRKNGAKVIVCSHLGSPKGVDTSLTLAPVAKRLTQLLNTEVGLAPDCVGPQVESLVTQMKDGDVLLLENLRFHAEEEKNDPAFCQQLKKIADAYVNDAFGTAHRAHASTAGVVPLFDVRAGGLTMRDELTYFRRAFDEPRRPFVAIFGGVKISTKMAALRNVGKKADAVLVGGAMANTMLAAEGRALGRSLVEKEEIENARAAMKELRDRGCQVLLPVDVVAAEEFKEGAASRTCSIEQIGSNEMALDIGEETLKTFAPLIANAGTIIWNGPMGAFETKGFHEGTFGLIKLLGKTSALTVVGGGDTDLALHETHSFEQMDYVSTGGGAFLKLLEGKKLPAVAALES